MPYISKYGKSGPDLEEYGVENLTGLDQALFCLEEVRMELAQLRTTGSYSRREAAMARAGAHLHDATIELERIWELNAMDYRPAIPEKPPERFLQRLPPRVRNVDQAWERVARALHLMATTGWSLRKELMEVYAGRLGITPRSGSVRRMFEKYLVDAGLVETEVYKLRLKAPVGLALTRLTDFGQALCWECGWRPLESEWERLIRKHRGNEYWHHTTAVIAFAYHARLRGWVVEVLPEMGQARASPDALIEKDDERIYVEVELGNGKKRKWYNQRELQGFVAFCTTTPGRRRCLEKEARMGARDRSTDLDALFRGAKGELPGPLWKGTTDVP